MVECNMNCCYMQRVKEEDPYSGSALSRRDSDSVLSLAGSLAVASGEANQATAAQTGIILVSHLANIFPR